MKALFSASSNYIAQPSPDTVIYDRAGHTVDVSGAVWRLNNATKSMQLDWSNLSNCSQSLVNASKAYIKELITTKSSAVAKHAFSVLCMLKRSPSFVRANAADEAIPFSVAGELSESLGAASYRIHYFRQWYVWCCDHGYEDFSPDVAFRLGDLRIGGNAKAVAVMSADPDDGPLVDLEVVALLNALRSSKFTGTLDVQQRAALWLCVALGSNAMQLALLREEDFERYSEPDRSGGVFGLRVPRHKKGSHKERTEFKLRKLTAEIGEVVEELIAFNRARRAKCPPLDSGIALPLFSRLKPRTSMLSGPLREYALGLGAQEFTSLVQDAVSRLGVVSPRTGRPLHVTTRRLRYTFATRLVREGASQRLVAELLDHSDLQNVQCYFDLKSDIVGSLDRAMAMTLGPVAQAFLGHIVRAESEAVRGEKPSSRVYGSRPGEVSPVGTCGSFSFCGLFAPVACYTCVKFQPWLEAPHEQVFKDLLAERRKREEQGLDARMVAINDATILAVADVVSRIAEIRTGDAPNVG